MCIFDASSSYRGAPPLGLPPHALSRAASPARSVRVARSCARSGRRLAGLGWLLITVLNRIAWPQSAWGQDARRDAAPVGVDSLRDPDEMLAGVRSAALLAGRRVLRDH